MNYRRTTGIIVLTATLMGCGGGAESQPESSIENPSTSIALDTAASDTTASMPSVEESSSEEAVSALDAIATRTSDLSVGQDFNFTSSFDLSVDVNLTKLANVDSYLTICLPVEANGLSEFSNVNRCMLKTLLVNGTYLGSVSLTNDVTSLVVSVWNFDGGSPLVFNWSSASGSDEILLSD